ncbi:Uncharacterised protein [Mycobacteroides abscessus subsp. abscessus]|nr:Uncharacterised protein [Mycobacteroides abscessus subsp. abscessus]
MGSNDGEKADTPIPGLPPRRFIRSTDVCPAPKRRSARRGNMFSTATWTSLESSSAATCSANPSAYRRCHRNGGCTTTVCAPNFSAARTLRSSFGIGLAPQTRCDTSKHGACTDNTGMPYLRESFATALTS